MPLSFHSFTAERIAALYCVADEWYVMVRVGHFLPPRW